MADHQPECIVCSAKDKPPFHKITYERTPGKPEEPSLAERLSKILKVDNIYSAYNNRVYTYPFQLCAVCLAQLAAIESASKAKKDFKRAFKKVLWQAQVIPSTCGAVEEGSISAKKKKKRKSECELSVGDLELCIREIDELITQTLQDELVHKGKSSTEKTYEPELLSTELVIVKEMFCEMEKEVGKIESPKELSGSAKPGGVIHELLMKQRITSNYKDKLVQHLKRMISYISKGSSRFECKGDGLQRFCDVLEIVFSQDPKEKDSERGDIADDNTDNLSVSSTQSSMSCNSISLNLKQSVQDIFRQTASQIADAWRERRRSVKATKDQTLGSKRKGNDNEEQEGNGQEGNEQEDKELVIGAQVQKIINGEEDEQEVIDIESLGSEETNAEEAPDDAARKPEEGATEESAEDKEEEEELGDGSAGQSSSDKDGPMVIDSDDDDLDQDTTAKIEVKTEPKVCQDDIQEIKLTKEDVPVICIDSDDDSDDDKSTKESNKDSVVANDPFDISNMPSFEESRWKYQQEKQGEQGSKDCFIVNPGSSGNIKQPNWPGCTSNSGETMPASGGRGVFPHKGKFSSAAGIVFGNMVGGGGQHRQVKQQPRYGNHFLVKYSNHFSINRRTNIWTNGKGNQRQFEPYIGGISQRFKFKKKFKQKPHFNQQGNASAAGNKNQKGVSHKFQFKHKHGKKRLQNSPANAESLPSSIGSPTSGSKLDIIPVIPSKEINKQVGTGSKAEQGSQWTPGTNPPGAVTDKQQKSQHHKFKLKKKHQGKQQHNKKHYHYNPGSKPVVTKQHLNHGNPHYRASGGMFQPGKSSFQKTSQPPVMQVLGSSSSQTLNVKASW